MNKLIDKPENAENQSDIVSANRKKQNEFHIK